MKTKKTTSKTVVKHLRAFADFLEEESCKENLKLEAEWLNEHLDELHSMDYFGTEGQCDPRGDHRE